MEFFGDLEDPRIERCKRHQLLDIITIAICAVICGADSWVHVEMFGKSKEEWFRTFLELGNGIPSHDTFGDVFSRLDPDRFQECFMEWSQAVANLLPGEVVAIDGKTVRRSHDKRAGRKAIHLVSAWASANTLTLGQVMTGEKSNEITAIPRLLEMLELKGCIRNHRCHGMSERRLLKGFWTVRLTTCWRSRRTRGGCTGTSGTCSRGLRRQALTVCPTTMPPLSTRGMGRIERRECWVIRDPVCLGYLSTGKEWPGLRSVVKVVGRRETEKGNTAHARYYISSLEVPAGQSLSASRAHWSIENSLHWSLDVTFREDQSRMRKDHSPQNMATLRQIAHNQLKRETSLKVGIQGQAPASRLERRLPAKSPPQLKRDCPVQFGD